MTAGDLDGEDDSRVFKTIRQRDSSSSDRVTLDSNFWLYFSLLVVFTILTIVFICLSLSLINQIKRQKRDLSSCCLSTDQGYELRAHNEGSNVEARHCHVKHQPCVKNLEAQYQAVLQEYLREQQNRFSLKRPK